MRINRIFLRAQPVGRRISWADLIVIAGLIAVIFGLIELSRIAPHVISAPKISTDPRDLPLYAVFSTTRMFLAYILSLIFTFVYGSLAASSKQRERVLLPILDILQSVPILAYLPMVVMALTAILPLGIAKEFSAVLLIFTSQAWNMTFSWYQSLTTTPRELKEASSIFQLSPWMRFTTLSFPFSAIGLIWNSVMSWAGGWFALMAAEMFHTANRQFELPGLGSYIQQAANDSNYRAIFWGIATLVVVIVLLDQCMWRPLLAWADKFRLDMVSSEMPASSWVYDAFSTASVIRRFRRKVVRPAARAFDQKMRSMFPPRLEFHQELKPIHHNRPIQVILIVAMSFLLFASFRFMANVSFHDWGLIALGLLATTFRVFLALTISVAWTIPVGYAIASDSKISKYLQPLTQLAASIPATALYPLFLVGLLRVRGGLEIAAMLLMLSGTQWYVLFNVIAGARAIPQDLKYTAQLMGLSGWEKWKTFILPALFPFIATGAITAAGGAWNASIFAEYTQFGGGKYSTAYGIGAIVSGSQNASNYPLLMASTLTMVLAVIIINRLVWKRIYATAEERFRLE